MIYTYLLHLCPDKHYSSFKVKTYICSPCRLLGPPQPQGALPSVVTVFTVYTALCSPGTPFILTVLTSFMLSALAHTLSYLIPVGWKRTTK